MIEKKRCALLVLYDKNGIFGEEVFFLINEIRTVAERLICVVNGMITEPYKSRVEELSDDFVIRENQGMDAEAYKHVILDYLSENELSNYEEILFCNDTFFGPFEPMRSIFSKMEGKDCDFWGISRWDEWINRGIHSYFLVFRECVIKNKELNYFFCHVLVEPIRDFYDAVFMFERGIFNFLIGKKYCYATYMEKLDFNLYAQSNLAISQGYPILKKKSFSKENYHYETILHSLKLIMNQTDYDLSYILEFAERVEGIELNVEEIKVYVPKVIKSNTSAKKTEADYIEAFLKNNKKIYIYGVGGFYTEILLYYFNKYQNKIIGFIVSEGRKKQNWYKSLPVYELGEIVLNQETPIIVALGFENSKLIKGYLENYTNVLYLFEGI